MKQTRMFSILLALGLASTPGLHGAPEQGDGQVQLPLEAYTQLMQQATEKPRRPALAGWALGNAAVTVTVEDAEQRASGAVQVQLGIDALEDEWVLIPVLPAGTPIESVNVDGKIVQLSPTAEGLAWSTNKSGSYTMRLSYRIDAGHSEGGFALPVPLPRAAAINLSATLPGTGLDATVIPAAGTRVTPAGTRTQVTATVPTTSGVLISWRVPARRGHSISRAGYSGKLSGDAVVWTGELTVELFNDETATVPLLPRSATLSDVKVDGQAGTILAEGDRFVTLVKGRGAHRITIAFQTPVERPEGPPRVDLRIPQIPVSRFELELPGKKELAVSPAANVTSKVGKETTVAVVHVPLTDRVVFSWSEAVPQELKTELRAHAAAYHLVHAEEGVLYVHAIVAYEITRGETNVVDLVLPAGVQVGRIESGSGAVADWRLSAPAKDGTRIVSVFLDRRLQGTLLFDVYYDRSLKAGEAERGLAVPLLRAAQAERQKGMVALLSSSELTLNPLETAEATKVGENQLPPFVREAAGLTVAHAFKYTEALPQLRVLGAQPERAQGKFDAEVDTLISLGDVTLTGSASVQVQVKSGRIGDLRLELPHGVSLLNLTAPSLRTHRVEEGQGSQAVGVEFTQDMEGQFRLDLTYERILTDGETRLEVPTLTVVGADVERGRIAVEALSAVEVQPAVTEQLSSVEVSELPQQLVLRTTNPILLAYKYVHADSPHRLALAVARHAVLGVQEAAIDRATYKTLFTPDGLLVTAAEFTVRNSRKQFLRLRLPEESEVWSAFVDGKPEKPALAEGAGGASRDILIKIINSTRPFDVQVIYATTGERIGRLGTIEGWLPNPDILVTHSRWEVFLPEQMSYGRPSSNMELAQDGSRVSRDEIAAEMAGLADAATLRQAIEPLRIVVPTAGVHYAFEKLYANQNDQRAWFELPYASAAGAALGQSASLSGSLLFWLGLGLAIARPERWRRLGAAAIAATGIGLAFVSMGLYHVSPLPTLVVSLVALSVAAAYYGRRLMPWLRDYGIPGRSGA